jgi:hypothetical protein
MSGKREAAPLRRVMLGLRKPGDVGAGVFQSDELATARQWYRIIEAGRPGQAFTRN